MKSWVHIPTNGNFLSDEDNGQEVTGYFTEEGRRKIQNHYNVLIDAE
jgi:ribosomal protein S12